MNTTCLHCGETVRRPPSRANRKFCRRACYEAAMRTPGGYADRPDYRRRPNARGDWECSGEAGCGRWLGAYAFPLRNGKPTELCRDCFNAYRSTRKKKKLRDDPAAMERERRRWRTLNSNRIKARKAERDARLRRIQDAIREMIEGGWSIKRIAEETESRPFWIRIRRDGLGNHVTRPFYRKTVDAHRRFLAERG